MFGELLKAATEIVRTPVDVVHGVARSVGLDDLTEPVKNITDEVSKGVEHVGDCIDDVISGD